MDTKVPNKVFVLGNGYEIPSIGCGTSSLIISFDNLTECLIEAVKIGYRHIDTAHCYKNYSKIREALEEILKTVKREELFITTKIINNNQTTPEEDIKEGLSEIGLTYFDLVLIHWPYGPRPIHELWWNFEKCVNLGYTKSIGVSSFNVQTLHDILTYAKIRPVCNQIEYHVYCQQDILLDYCKKQKIQVVAWSPFFKGGKTINGKEVNPFQDETLIQLSQKYNKSIAQLMLCWMITKEIIPIPKSTKIQNIQNNFDCYFEIKQEDINTMNDLNQNLRMQDFSKYEQIKYNLFV